MRKLFLISFFVLLHVLSFCADRYWVGNGSSANYNATAPTNWAATSGGAGNQSVPGVSDNVIFDGAGASGNTACTISANAGALTLTFTSGYTQTITQNNATTITIAGSFTDNTAHTWTVNGSGSMTITAASTITSGGKTYPGPVSFSGTNTKTLSGDWTIGGALTTANTTTINSGTLTCAGLTVTGTSCSGTTVIQLSGGTWSGNVLLQNSLTFAGNVTVSGTVIYNTGTMTYASGAVTTTSSTLTLSNSATLNTNGISWANVISSGATSTITLNSLLTATVLTCNAGTSTTWAGTAGFTVGTLTMSQIDARTQTLKNGVTYTITTAFNCFLSRNGAIVAFTSDDGTIKAILTLQQGATCNVLASFTRIDASAGRTIWTFNGTVTTCLNINSFSDLKTVSKSFVQ